MRTLVIGGGGGGIGRAVVRILAGAGAIVAVADVDETRAQEAAIEIGGIALGSDVRRTEAVEDLVVSATEKLGDSTRS